MVKRKNQSTSRKTKKNSKEQDDIIEEQPDLEEEDFVYDEVDKFHRKRENDILGEDESDLSLDDIEEYEEVLGIDVEDKSSEFSDNEEESEINDDIPSSKAWGKRRSAFYGAEKLDGLQGFDRDDVQDEEEEEALRIQQRLVQEIDEDQFENFPIVDEKREFNLNKIIEVDQVETDVSNLSDKAQWKLLKQEAPELKDLITDFKVRSAEVDSHLGPLMNLVKQNKIVGSGAAFIKTCYNLHLSYLINISFYMSLKSKRIPVHNHPVIKRLVEFRTLINRLEPICEKLAGEIDDILLDGESSFAKHTNSDFPASVDSMDDESEGDSESISSVESNEEHINENENKVSSRMTAVRYYTALQERLIKSSEDKLSHVENEEFVPNDAEDRRAINYKMSKNEGLKGKKRKIDRNPRVKHREKFRKAKIKRKSQVRVHKPEINKYGGEASGIRAGVVRSVRIG